MCIAGYCLNFSFKTDIGSRYVSVAASSLWDSLPDNNVKMANRAMTFLRLFSFRVFPEVGVDGRTAVV